MLQPEPQVEPAPTDAQLLAQFRAKHDPDAFAELVDRHHRLVLGVCLRTLGNQHDAEDAFQATFLVLARNASRIRRPRALASWLYGVAHRTSLRLRRQRSRATTLQLEDQIVSAKEPLDLLLQAYQQELADQELSRLPPRLREPVLLRYLEGMSNSEVAARLKLSVAAVEGRLKRAKSKLRGRLARHGITWVLAFAAIEASQRQVQAASCSALLEQTVRGSVAIGRAAQGDNVAGEVVEHLAREEVLAMTTSQLLKVALVGTLAVCTISAPLAWRHLMASAVAGEPAATRVAEDPFGAAVPAADPFGDGEPSAEVTVRVQANGAADPFGAGELGLAGQAGERVRYYDVKSRSDGELAIDQALRSPVEVDFLDDPLDDVVTFLHDRHGIPIVLDRRSLEDVALTGDDTVTGSLSGISLRSALNIILRDLGLTYVIENEMLVITTPDYAETLTETRVYALPAEAELDVASLAEIIPAVVEPDSWDSVGGVGTIVAHGRGLVVLQTQEVHDKINDLIEQLRQLEKLSSPSSSE